MMIVLVIMVLWLFLMELLGQSSLFFHGSQMQHVGVDRDVYLQATRGAMWTFNRRFFSNLNQSRTVFGEDYYRNVVFDEGRFEGLARGYAADFRYEEYIKLPLVPYGCWHRSSEHTGIYINLGPNVLIDDRRQVFRALDLPDYHDRLLCTKALRVGYSSIVTNNPPSKDTLAFGTETVICYGGCGTTPKFNLTCPPGIDTRKGFRAHEECECSDAVPSLNCNGNYMHNGAQAPASLSSVGENRCIMETFDLASKQIYRRRDVNMTIFFTYELMRNSQDTDRTIAAIYSMADMEADTLVLNLEHTEHALNGKVLRLNNGDIKSAESYQYVADAAASMLLYSSSLDDLLSSRKLITVRNMYVGVITNFKVFDQTYDRLHWLLDDARCLKQLGAYIIVLISGVDYHLSKHLMAKLENYVDVIMSIGGAVESISPSHYHQYHHHNESTNSIYNIDRILHLKDQIRNAPGMEDPTAASTAIDIGRVQLQKLSSNQLIIDSNIVRFR